MDFATLIGLISGISIITLAVASTSDFLIFLNVPGFLIVVGGTGAAILIKFPLKVCFHSIQAGLRTAFIDRSERPEEIIKLATKLSDIKRKKGHLELEKVPIRNALFRKGVQLIVDGRKPDIIEKILTLEQHHAIERHQAGERVFRAIGDSAPAFGMLGTLIGLVQMMTQMDDPQKIGVGMAIALLTTLYGSLIANLFAIPIADKLQMRHESEYNSKALIIESVLNIEQGENPRVMEEILLTYVSGNEKQMFVNQHHASKHKTVNKS